MKHFRGGAGSLGCFCARGFSLIELMIAMVIALVVMAGVIASFIASKDAYRYSEEVSSIQENGRFVLDRLSREVREAGNFGCQNSNATPNGAYRANLVSVISGAAGVLYKRYGIEGFDRSEAAGSFPATIMAGARVKAAGTDVIVVRRGDPDNIFVVRQHNVTAATPEFELMTQHNLSPGTFMIVSSANCQHQALFQMTGPAAAAAGSNKIEHAVGGALVPGNCSKQMVGNRDIGPTAGTCANCPGGNCSWRDMSVVPVDEYPSDSRVMTLASTIFYISTSSIDPTVPALYSQSFGVGGTVTTDELAAGVEDLRVAYGLDTDAIGAGTGPDGVADRYVRADQVTAGDEPAGANYLAWNRVVSVRVDMVIRSRQPVLDSALAVTLLGKNYNDRFLRQVVSTTIRVRNPFQG